MPLTSTPLKRTPSLPTKLKSEDGTPNKKIKRTQSACNLSQPKPLDDKKTQNIPTVFEANKEHKEITKPTDTTALNTDDAQPQKITDSKPQLSTDFTHEEFTQLKQENQALKHQIQKSIEAIENLSKQIANLQQEVKQQKINATQHNANIQTSMAPTMPANYMQHHAMPSMPFIEPIDVESFYDCVNDAKGNIEQAQMNFLNLLARRYPPNSTNVHRHSILYAQQVRAKYCMQNFEYRMQQQTMMYQNYATQANYYYMSNMHALQQQCLSQMGAIGGLDGNYFGAYGGGGYPMPNYITNTNGFNPMYARQVPQAEQTKTDNRQNPHLSNCSDISNENDIPDKLTEADEKEPIAKTKSRKQIDSERQKNILNVVKQISSSELCRNILNEEDCTVENMHEIYLNNQQQTDDILKEAFFSENSNLFDSKQAENYFIKSFAKKCFADDYETNKIQAVNAAKELLCTFIVAMNDDDEEHVHGEKCNHQHADEPTKTKDIFVDKNSKKGEK